MAFHLGQSADCSTLACMANGLKMQHCAAAHQLWVEQHQGNRIIKHQNDKFKLWFYPRDNKAADLLAIA